MKTAEDYDEINKLQGIKTSWSLWELYRTTGAADYKSSIHKLITFKDYKEFCEILTFLPHGTPSRIFFDREALEIKKFKVIGKEEYKQIDSICLFRDEIPPLIESLENMNGGQYHYSLSEIKNSELEAMWLEMCVSLVTGEGITYSENINGFRLCDKSKPPKNFNIRLEVWLNNDLTDGEALKIHNSIKADIKTIMRKYISKFEESYKSSKKN